MATLNIPASDPLAFSRVQAFFGRRYPETGGVAIERLGSFTHNGGDFFGWPTGTGVLFAQDGITYTPPTVASGGQVSSVGILTQTTGSTIAMTNATMVVDLTIESIAHSSGTSNIEVRVANPDEASLSPTGSIDVFLRGTLTNVGVGRHTVTATVADGADTTWSTRSVLGIYITSDDSSRPYTATINSIRLSFDGSGFDRTGDMFTNYNRGGGIVPDYPSVGGFGFIYSNPTTFRILEATSGDVGWETGTPRTVGLSDWTYTPMTTAVVGGATSVTNSYVNNTGSFAGFASDSVASVDLTISNPEVGETPQANIIFRKIGTDGNYVAGGASANSFRVQDQVFTIGRQTVNVPATSAFNIQNGEGFRFYLTETGDAFTPFDVQIHSVFVSQTSSAFGEINTGISSTTSGLTLSSFRGVDDGES